MTPSMRLMPGAVFAGDFRIVAPLSEGGMGAVYVAEQTSTGKRRALKLMLPELVQNARLRTRFEQEARVGSRIDSEHVVEVVGAGVDGQTGAPWLAMELLEGTDLGKWRAQKTQVAMSDVRAILAELCHAVGAAHAVGIVHRDLKPENVFVSKSKRLGSPFMIKVLDFGIAKLVDEARSTKTAAVGTPLWMAPEQTEASSEVYPATDVWAIGLIAFWLLTGRTYWRGGNLESISLSVLMREVVLDPLVGASQRAAELGAPGALPPGFDAWFARAVQRDPRARFPDARAAHAALDPILVSAGAGSTMVSAGPAPYAAPPNTPPYGPPPPYAMPMGPPPKTGWGCWIWGLIISSILAVLGGGACIGGSVWYVMDRQSTCQDNTADVDERLDACGVACDTTSESDAPYCLTHGDLLAGRGDTAGALEKYDAACKYGQSDACTKAAALRAK